MLCPSCGSENLEGADVCDHCGVDLSGIDRPEPRPGFEARLLAERLSNLAGRPVVKVGPDATVGEAIRSMQDQHVGCVLVMDGERLAGIFTEHDALLRLGGAPDELEGLKVGEVMTADPVVLHEEDSVAVAIHKMAVGRFHHIPLVSGTRVTAVVSARDIFHDFDVLLG